MRTIVVQNLIPDQRESWTFTLEPLQEGGGSVSVPATMSGYPIDWPPRIPAQAQWLDTITPDREACAGAAWRLKPHAWERLIAVLEAQEHAERAISPAGG